MSMNTTLIAALFGAASLLALSTPALAIPKSLTHQGRLFDGEGKPVTGAKNARFTLYDSPAQGAIVWQGEVTLSLSSDGSFVAQLGSADNPLTEGVFNGERLWLEMNVEDETLAPRLPISSVPYAFRAGSVVEGAIQAASLAPGVLDWSNIQNAPADALTALGCSNPNEVPQWDGAAWRCAVITVDQATVDALAAQSGYVKTNACPTPGHVLAWSGQAWSCVVDATLTEAQVDAFVANNGFVTANLCASNGQVLGRVNNAWGCITPTPPLTEAQVDAFVANNGYLVGPLTDATVPDAISISNTAIHAPNAATNVGVNTTTTTAALTVNGDIHLSRDASPRFIGIPDALGGRPLTIKAGGFSRSDGSGGNGGDLTLQGGNSNVSQPNIACPDESSAGGNIVLRAGYNVTNFVCGAKRSGHIIFYAGDGDVPSGQPEVMRIFGDRRNVGIGISDPSAAYRLHVAGATAASSFATLSDQRFKQDVRPLVDPLKVVQSMRGVSYDWRRHEYPEHQFDQGRQIGFIAQELAVVLPEAVERDERGIYRVEYNKVIPVLVEGIKAQQDQIDGLRDELARAQREQRLLLARMDKLETRQSALEVSPAQAGLGAFGLLSLLGLGVGLRRRAKP